MLPDHSAKLQLRQVCIVQAHVVRPGLHLLEVIQAVNKDSHYVADVDVVSLEMALKDHHRPVVESPIDEVIHQQVNAHSRRDAEDRRQAKAYAVLALEDGFLGFYLGHAVERDWAKRRVLRAVDA